MTRYGRIYVRGPKQIVVLHSLSAAYPQDDYAGFASPHEPLAAHKLTDPVCQPPA